MCLNRVFDIQLVRESVVMHVGWSRTLKLLAIWRSSLSVVILLIHEVEVSHDWKGP